MAPIANARDGNQCPESARPARLPFGPTPRYGCKRTLIRSPDTLVCTLKVQIPQNTQSGLANVSAGRPRASPLPVGMATIPFIMIYLENNRGHTTRRATHPRQASHSPNPSNARIWTRIPRSEPGFACIACRYPLQFLPDSQIHDVF